MLLRNNSIVVGLLVSSDTVLLGSPDLPTAVASGKHKDDDKNDKDDNRPTDRALSIDELFVKVTKKHPEFGGMFIDEDEDTIFVYLLDGDLDAVVKKLKKVFGEENLPQRNAEVLEAKYSFLQLKKWHDRLAERVFQIPEVHLTDINDETNRLTVGIENLDARGRVEEQLEALGIPIEAVEIEEIGPFQLEQQPVPVPTPTPPPPPSFPSPPSCTDAESINDRCRPLVGGLQIDFSLGIATLGFIAEREDVQGFVTNSHNSTMQGEPDGTVYSQPLSGSNNQIGIETIDPDFQDFFCPIPLLCRASDSNFSVLNEGVSAAGLGYIARPNVLNTEEVSCFDLNQNNEIVPTNPEFCAWDGESTFRITAEELVFVGTQVTKVGQRTGMTEGLVLRIELRARQEGNIILPFQAMADYASADGDSGSSVIRGWGPYPNSNPVNTALLGIHWGAGTSAVFSYIRSVEFDLGSLNTCAPPIQC